MNNKLAEEYIVQNKALMKEWEVESRQWLKDNNCEDKATFYKDGVFDPDTWFGNDVRPLFILKEVHESDELRTDKLSVNFVEMNKDNINCDPWRGDTVMWRRMGTLADGLLKVIKSPNEVPEYKLFKNNVQELELHRSVLKQIAVMNLKKYPGGSNAGHEKSERTIGFMTHALKYADYLEKQIKIMNPTIIICCGKGEIERFVKTVLKIDDIPVIDGYHPSSRGIKFYNYTLQSVVDVLK